MGEQERVKGRKRAGMGMEGMKNPGCRRCGSRGL